MNFVFAHQLTPNDEITCPVLNFITEATVALLSEQLCGEPYSVAAEGQKLNLTPTQRKTFYNLFLYIRRTYYAEVSVVHFFFGST